MEPYPSQYTTKVMLPAAPGSATRPPFPGGPVTLRALQPEDEPLLARHHATLSDLTIRRRFFSMVKILSRESLSRLCHLDYTREMALVAEGQDDHGQPFFMGVARYHPTSASGVAEFAVVVSDRFQGLGLGFLLMHRLIQIARERGIKTLVGLVLRDNAAMLQFSRDLGFTGPFDVDETTVEMRLDL